MIYAVNRLTKEHRVVEERYSSGMRLPCRNPNLGKGWDYIQADADGWIEWSGGECPLPKHVKCDHIMRFTPERDAFVVELAGHLRWTHENLRGDIIAYRPIIDQPASEEPKGWDGEGLPPVGTPLEGEHADYGWIKGRFMFHDEGERVVVLKTEHGYLGFGVYRTIPTPRERWVDKAALAMGAKRPQNANHLGLIYDALASGELPTPEKTQ